MSTLSPEQERLVTNNLRFAESVARKTARKLPIGGQYGIPMDVHDCIQQGYIGLLQAAIKFDAKDHDPSRGSLDKMFRSYAYNRIRGAIIDEVRRQTFVRRRGIEKGYHVQMLSTDEIDDYEIDNDVDLWLDTVGAMDILSDREYKVILGLILGMSGKELASGLGITESRVSQIAHDARIKLKEAIGDGRV